jgi:rare lipoprotein A
MRDQCFRDHFPIYGISVLVARMRRRCLPGLLMTGLAMLGQHGAQAANRGGESWLSERGIASFYGSRHNGRRTAQGGRFDQEAMTGAHHWLPFGTRVRVTALETGRSIVVTITDRMGARRRIIDLSKGAARSLGILGQGVALVSLSPD